MRLFWQGPPHKVGRSGARALAPAAVLLGISPLLALLAAPILGYTEALAAQLLVSGDGIAALEALEPADLPPATR